MAVASQKWERITPRRRRPTPTSPACEATTLHGSTLTAGPLNTVPSMRSASSHFVRLRSSPNRASGNREARDGVENWSERRSAVRRFPLAPHTSKGSI